MGLTFRSVRTALQLAMTGKVGIAPLVLVLSVLATLAIPMPAYAQLEVKVSVTIERVRALDGKDFDGPLDEADFFARVQIDGQEFENQEAAEKFKGQDDIRPGWLFPNEHVLASKGTIPVRIFIFEDDGLFKFENEEADLHPGPGLSLVLNVTLAPCGVSGDVSGNCDTTIVSGGDTEISFRIKVEDPPSAPGLNVRCLHSPIWPLEGGAMTINAAALDGALSPTLADTIEIWVQDRSAPANSGGGTTLTHTVPIPDSFTTEIAYACRVVDAGVRVFTGWRVVNIRQLGCRNCTIPKHEQAVPILYTGERSSSIDIVFIPDATTYFPFPSENAQFLMDLGTVIGAYYSEGVFLTNQDQINFWIKETPGTAKNGCESKADFDGAPRPRWDSDYAFADAGAIVHRTGPSFRDCAPSGERIFSGDATQMDGGLLGRVFLHETGHRPFGLADEYCKRGGGNTDCDGGYFQSDPFPNVYAELQDCVDEAPAGSACREWTDDDFWFLEGDWSTSEPMPNDLMFDNTTPQFLDVRRINWMFGRCQAASC